jgi:hypothetical protein
LDEFESVSTAFFAFYLTYCNHFVMSLKTLWTTFYHMNILCFTNFLLFHIYLISDAFLLKITPKLATHGLNFPFFPYNRILEWRICIISLAKAQLSAEMKISWGFMPWSVYHSLATATERSHSNIIVIVMTKCPPRKGHKGIETQNVFIKDKGRWKEVRTQQRRVWSEKLSYTELEDTAGHWLPREAK